MKKITLLVLICVMSLQVLAQTDCKNGVSTNPDAPTNNNLPFYLDGTNNVIQTGDKYLNRFNWLNQNGSIFYQYNLVNTTTKNLKK